MGSRTAQGQQRGLTNTNAQRSPRTGNPGAPTLTYSSGADLISQLSQAQGGPAFGGKAKTGYNPSPGLRQSVPTDYNKLYNSMGLGQATNSVPSPTGPAQIGSVQPQNYMGALNTQPGVTYNTQLQQQLANNSAQSQAPIGSSFVDALGRQQGVTYNVDMQKRMANTSAISQGLPPPFPGY